MNTKIPITVSLEFVLNTLDPTWRDMELGLENAWVVAPSVRSLAALRVQKDIDTREEVRALAECEPGDELRIKALVKGLAAREAPGEKSESKARWLYLIVAALYKDRQRFENPFDLLEEVYADFGFPKEISEFIPYMPPTDGYRPQDHTPADNLARLVRLWGAYVDGGPPGRGAPGG